MIFWLKNGFYLEKEKKDHNNKNKTPQGLTKIPITIITRKNIKKIQPLSWWEKNNPRENITWKLLKVIMSRGAFILNQENQKNK